MWKPDQFSQVQSHIVTDIEKNNAADIRTETNLCIFVLVNDAPLLKDLYEHVTPQYTAVWRVIGTLLDLRNEELAAIEAEYPTNFSRCCNKMLEKWLEVDNEASWNKICDVIESSAVSNYSQTKGTSNT